MSRFIQNFKQTPVNVIQINYSINHNRLFKVSAVQIRKTTPDKFSPELLELQRMAFEARTNQAVLPERVY